MWSQDKVFLFNNRLARQRYRGERGTWRWSVEMARFGAALHRESRGERGIKHWLVEMA